jgi:hypothetical protein
MKQDLIDYENFKKPPYYWKKVMILYKELCSNNENIIKPIKKSISYSFAKAERKNNSLHVTPI